VSPYDTTLFHGTVQEHAAAFTNTVNFEPGFLKQVIEKEKEKEKEKQQIEKESEKVVHRPDTDSDSE